MQRSLRPREFSTLPAPTATGPGPVPPAAPGSACSCSALGSAPAPTPIGVDALLDRADVVVTGEGKLDEQTLQGKGPAEVARRAQQRGLPVAAVAGAITLSAAQLDDAGIEEAWDLTSLAGSSRLALENGAELLVEVGRSLGAWATEARSVRARTDA